MQLPHGQLYAFLAGLQLPFCFNTFLRTRMKYMCLPLLLCLACSMAGDTLILKDGQKIEGRYLSSTDSAVQFEVNGKPFTYSTWLIRELRFHSGASPSPAPAPLYTGPRGQEQQDQFCTVLKNYIQARNKVAAEANPIRRAEMHPPDPWSFEDSIARFLARMANLWTGPGACFFPRQARPWCSPFNPRADLVPLSRSRTAIPPTSEPAREQPAFRSRLLWRTNFARPRPAAYFVCLVTCLLEPGPEAITCRVQPASRMRGSASKALKRMPRPMSRIHNIWRSSLMLPRQAINSLVA